MWLQSLPGPESENPALVNHWLRRMAADHYRFAQLVFGWSFYRQGTSGESSSADEFLDAALAWFGDPDPRIGTAWEKGERLAKLSARRRTLLILDGLEPLQNPPGPQEGRLRDPSLQALLRELGVFNTGLCVVTTRPPVTDIADQGGSSALHRDLDTSPARLVRSCCTPWVLKGREMSCEVPAMSSVGIVLPSRCWAAIWPMRTMAIFGVVKKYQLALLTT